MKSIVALVLFSIFLSIGITSHAQTPNEETPAVEDVCDGQVGAAYGLCAAYCEAMDCDSDNPKASEKACAKVEAKYMNKTGMVPPCKDLCADVTCPDGETCSDGVCFCGEDTTCASGEVCEEGVCTPEDPCADVTCPAGEACVDGECRCGEEPTCAQLEICQEGECIDQCAELAAVAECPCDYFDVPKTEECWTTQSGDANFTPCINGDCICNGIARFCSLDPIGPEGALRSIQAVSEDNNGDPLLFCLISEDFESCGGPDGGAVIGINSYPPFLTCLCRIEQYADKLYGAGININGGDPPFSCGLTTCP